MPCIVSGIAGIVRNFCGVVGSLRKVAGYLFRKKCSYLDSLLIDLKMLIHVL
jgi:hypothetical protein